MPLLAFLIAWCTKTEWALENLNSAAVAPASLTQGHEDRRPGMVGAGAADEGAADVHRPFPDLRAQDRVGFVDELEPVVEPAGDRSQAAGELGRRR